MFQKGILQISNLYTAKYDFKSCTLAKLWAEMLFRFQWQIVKWLLKLCLGPGVISISPLKSSSREKKETKNVKINILTNTPLIFLIIENRNILIVLHKKLPRLNDKKNIDIVVKMLLENDITLKSIGLMRYFYFWCSQNPFGR